MFIRQLFTAGTKPAGQRSVLRPMTRGFSQSVKPPSSGAGPASYIMMGAGLAGLTYLTWKTSEMNSNKAAYMAQGETFMSPIVQQRLGKTLGYFGYGIFSTSAFIYGMRNSFLWATVNPWVLFGGTIALMFGTHMVDYETMWPLKMACYTAFTGAIGLSILPLVQASSAALVADAALATGLSMTSLAMIAYNAPSEQFLNWGGPLALGCGGMMAISLLSMFYPQSKALYNVWLYGGLALTGGLTLFRTQALIYKAKTEAHYDPLGNSIGIYMDAVNFFVRFLMILQGNKKK